MTPGTKALLSGLLMSAGLTLAQAQTNSTTAPLTPDGKASNATPRADDPTGAHGPQRGRAAGQAATSSGSAAATPSGTAAATMGVDHMQSKREANAAYTEAKRHCKTLARDERSACMKQARADRKHSTEMSTDHGSTSGSR